MSTLEDTFGPIIHRYTRAQALADGALRDVTATAAEAGFRWPVAVTASVWADCIAWDPHHGCQDEDGRLWDVVWMASHAARTAKASGNHESLLPFSLHRIQNQPGACASVDETDIIPTVNLWLHVGPDDEGKPVVTIMFPSDW